VSFPIKVNKIKSDIFQNPGRDAEYHKSENWLRFGKSQLVITDKKMEKMDYEDKSSNTYADVFKFIDIL
jgi:hypothetical protein